MSGRSRSKLLSRAARASLLGCLSLTPSFAAEIGSFCVHHYSAGIECTANEAWIAALEPVTILEDCASGDPQTAEAVFEVTVSAGPSSRYDIGWFVALNGDSALSGGQCLHDYLEPPLETAPTYGDADGNGRPDLHDGPWWNGEPFEPQDECGDLQAGTDSIKTLISFRFSCKDSTFDGIVDFSTCTSWSAGTSSRCQGLSDAYPPTSARCGCNVVESGIPMPGAGRVSSLTLAPAGLGDLQLSWAPSCSVSDDDYEIYEGTLGDFTSHESVLCTTGGATSATIQPSSGSGYYLVVPRNPVREGSYGTDGAGAERPPATNACVLQSAEAACF